MHKDSRACNRGEILPRRSLSLPCLASVRLAQIVILISYEVYEKDLSSQSVTWQGPSESVNLPVFPFYRAVSPCRRTRQMHRSWRALFLRARVLARDPRAPRSIPLHPNIRGRSATEQERTKHLTTTPCSCPHARSTRVSVDTTAPQHSR